jgi:hypothetical protein
MLGADFSVATIHLSEIEAPEFGFLRSGDVFI